MLDIIIVIGGIIWIIDITILACMFAIHMYREYQ